MIMISSLQELLKNSNMITIVEYKIAVDKYLNLQMSKWIILVAFFICFASSITING